MTNRREFLKQITLLGVVATLPTHNLLAGNILSLKPVGDGLSTLSYAEELRSSKLPRKITIPGVGVFKVLKGDFHIHTLFSDGRVMPKERVTEAVDNGLDVIAITDHIESRTNIGGGILKLANNNDDRNRTYDFAKEEAEKNNLILVRGGEITKSEWHFNALFVQDVNTLAAVIDDWRVMLAVATDQGGFIHWNHPNWLDRTPDKEPFGLKSGEPLRFFDEIEEVRKKGHLHGVEVFNGYNHYPIVLDWCNERNLAPLANSDIHPSEWDKYGHQNPFRPMTLVLAHERSHDSVREALLAKRTIGWAANMIFGKPEWVEKLFHACVETKKTAGGLTLRNISDIPCLIETNDQTFELPAQGTVEIRKPSVKQLVVSNWFVGMNKPLEIAIPSLVLEL